MFKNYDPKLVVVSFTGIPLLGYAPGTFVEVDRAEDAFKLVAGATGDVTRVRNRKINGSVTVTLQAESPTNDLLSAQAELDRIFGTGFGPLLVKNINGTTICMAEIAWIKKPAKVEYSDDASNREWVFDCAELLMLVGGAIL